MKLKHLVIVLTACILASCQGMVAEKRLSHETSGPVSARALNKFSTDKGGKLLNVAMSMERAGQHDNALKTLYQHKANHGSQPIQTDLAIIRIMKKLGQKSASRILLDELYAKYPQDTAVKAALMDDYLQEAEYDKAKVLLGIVNEASDVQVVKQAAILELLNGNPTKSQELFTLYQKQSTAPAALELKSLSFAIAGDYARAVQIIQPVLNKPTSRNEARYTLGLIYALSGQYKAAMQFTTVAMGEEFATSKSMYLKILAKMTIVEKTRAIYMDQISTETLDRILPSLK